jgi:hypothetical protein
MQQGTKPGKSINSRPAKGYSTTEAYIVSVNYVFTDLNAYMFHIKVSITALMGT